MSRIYEVEFADGKRATVIDMTDDEPAEAARSIAAAFHSGYVVRIRRKRPQAFKDPECPAMTSSN